MSVTLAYSDADAALAQRLSADLATVIPRGDAPVLVALISPAAAADADVLRQIETAREQQQGVVVVLAAQTPLPTVLHGRKPLDFSGGAYPFDALKRQIDALSARPPSVRQRNRLNGITIGLLVLIMFVLGLYVIGVLGYHPPADEFIAVETARVEQRNTLIAPTMQALIPVGQFEISQFDLTVTAVPTRLREFIVGTVTATSQGTYIPSPTPRPSQTPSQ